MNPDHAASALKIILVVFGVLFVYLMPLAVAQSRRHRNRLAIGVTNVLVGWTVLGWFVAMIWACTANIEPPPIPAARRVNDNQQ
jgi:hypothetical protein